MKRFVILLGLVGAVIGCWLGLAKVTMGQGPSAPQTQAPTKCDQLQVVLIVDQSGSMSLTFDTRPPSDPLGLRFFGPKKAVETLSSLRYHTYFTSTIYVATVNFGDSPRVGLPWTVITPTLQSEHDILQKAVAPAFEPIPSLGNTNPLAAFQNASSLFNQLPVPQTGCVTRGVILLTDGQPSLPAKDFSWQNHLSELAKYVQQYMPPPQYQIYVIGIDTADSYWNNVKPYWDRVTGDPNKAVRATDQVQMTSLVIQFANELAQTLTPSGANAETHCLSSGTVVVPPFVQQISLTLIKTDLGLHLRVMDENNRLLDPTRTDVKVTATGEFEPIETLTVNNPHPGLWTIQTPLPPDFEKRCQVQTVSFSALGKLNAPGQNNGATQFQKLPIGIKIVDSSGAALPDYGDPKYALKVDLNIVGPSQTPISVNTQAKPNDEFVGEVIPLESGAHELTLKATSQNPDGTERVVVSRTLETLIVKPVELTMLDGPAKLVAQHLAVPLKLGITTNGNPVVLDLAREVSATLTFDNATEPVTLTEEPDGTYDGMLQPDKVGTYVLTFQGDVSTPPGKVAFGQQQVTFESTPTQLVGVKVVSPGDQFVATDLLLRPSGLPLELQLVGEDGKDMSPGQVGAANPMAVFGISVVDGNKKDRSSEVKLVNTGKPGLFRLENNTLGMGSYDIQVTPASDLGSGFLWSQKSWTFKTSGIPNPGFFVLVAGILAGLGVIAIVTRSEIALRRYPLSGYILVSKKQPDPEGNTYSKNILRRQLPNRNRAVITPSAGLPGLLERLLPISLGDAGEIRRIIVTSRSEADAKQGVAYAEVQFKSGSKMTTTLGPSIPESPLGMEYFIEKGPRTVYFGSEDSGGGEFFQPAPSIR